MPDRQLASVGARAGVARAGRAISGCGDHLLRRARLSVRGAAGRRHRPASRTPSQLRKIDQLVVGRASMRSSPRTMTPSGSPGMISGSIRWWTSTPIAGRKDTRRTPSARRFPTRCSPNCATPRSGGPSRWSCTAGCARSAPRPSRCCASPRRFGSARKSQDPRFRGFGVAHRQDEAAILQDQTEAALTRIERAEGIAIFRQPRRDARPPAPHP